MDFRKFALTSHRWLGLASAGVLSIIGLSGVALIWPVQAPLRMIANRLHENLWMGRVGNWIVTAFTAIALLLLLSGLFLWWRQKIVAVRSRSGWRRIMFELHHSLGILGFTIMLVLTLTGIGMAAPTHGGFRRMIAALHNARGFPLPIQVLYAAGTVAFLIESVTGIVMWWKPWRRSRDVGHTL